MIKVMGARLLVQRIEQKKPESELVIVPDTIQDKPSNTAVVWGVGKLEHGGVDVGDLVVIKDFVGAPVPVTLPGDELETDCVIVNEEDVLAVIEGV